jgi:hypothetical protein
LVAPAPARRRQDVSAIRSAATNAAANAATRFRFITGRAGIDQRVLAPEAGVWRWRGKLAGSDRLGQLMGDHLSRTNAEERRVLDLLAFGEPLPVELVAELGSADVLAEAEQHGFVVVEDTPAHPTVRLAHPLYGEVLRAGVPTLAARQYQCALAAAAMAVGWQHRDPMRVASWWLDTAVPSRVIRRCSWRRRTALWR